MNLYQLRDREDHNWGIIDTDAREEVLTKLWSNVLDNKIYMSEEFRNSQLIDAYDCLSQLIALLRASQYDVERVWLTEINPE